MSEDEQFYEFKVTLVIKSDDDPDVLRDELGDILYAEAGVVEVHVGPARRRHGSSKR